MASLEQLQSRLARHYEELDTEIAQVISELEAFLTSSLPAIIREASEGNIDPAIAVNNLINAFRTGGLQAQLGNIAELFGNEIRRIRDEFVKDGLMTLEQFQTLIDVDSIEALVRLRVDNISNKAVEVLGRLRPVILENAILGTNLDALVLGQAAKEALLNFTKTELNTALISFSRMVVIVQAESVGINLFYYVGPLDKITRDFCRNVLTKKNPPIYTRAEIERMNNDQGLPVMIYGGGYNCRHNWSALSREAAISYGYRS